MKFKALLLNSLIVGAFSVIGYEAGQFIGNSLIGEYNPPWNHYAIHPAPYQTLDIVHYDILSTLEDPTGDILYVATEEGEVYSNILFQSHWHSVEAIPASDNPLDNTECAPKWPGPTDDHMWDAPPVDKRVIDSAGVRFERPLSIISRCYVLSDDGSLEVWVHSGNALDWILGEFPKMVCTLMGTLLGAIFGITGLVFVRLRKSAKSSAQ